MNTRKVKIIAEGKEVFLNECVPDGETLKFGYDKELKMFLKSQPFLNEIDFLKLRAIPEAQKWIETLEKQVATYSAPEKIERKFVGVSIIYERSFWLAEHQHFLIWLLHRKKQIEAGTVTANSLWTGTDDQLTELHIGLAGWAVKSDLETFRQAFTTTESGFYIDWIESTRLLGYLLTMLCNVERLIPSNFAKLIGDGKMIKSKKGEFLKTNNIYQVTHQVNELKFYAKPKGSEKIDPLLKSLRV